MAVGHRLAEDGEGLSEAVPGWQERKSILPCSDVLGFAKRNDRPKVGRLASEVSGVSFRQSRMNTSRKGGDARSWAGGSVNIRR